MGVIFKLYTNIYNMLAEAVFKLFKNVFLEKEMAEG